MDDIKHLTNKHSYLQLSAVLHKQVKAIRAHKSATLQSAADATADGGTGKTVVINKTSATAVRHEGSAVACKENDQLKLQCLSDNVQLSQLAFQTFGRLVEERTLDPAAVISMFISMVPGASRTQLIALSEAVLQLLLLDLKQRGERYTCPFGLQTPQHPLLAFFQRTETSVPDVVGKIVGLCRHHDREIRRHSCEFLRPVYLFVFCNPSRFADTSPLWAQLLEQSKSSEQAQQLVLEVLGWSNVTSDGTLLQASTLLADTIESYKSDSALAPIVYELCVYLANLLPDLIARGYDPRPALATISTVLHQSATNVGNDVVAPYLNVLLVSLSHSLPICAPAYLTDLCRLLRHICVSARGGNAVTLRLLLSALINWLAAPQLLREDCLAHLHALVRHVTGGKWRHWSASAATPTGMRVKYFHPAVAFSVDLARHSERICRDPGQTADWMRDFRKLADSRPQFCQRINLYMRALFLIEADTVDTGDASDDIAEVLLQSVRSSPDASIDTFMTWLYRTLHEPHGGRLLRLLRGLTAFAVVKENIPKIIGALRSLGQSQAARLRPLILELYVSLWRCEDRTFVYLKNELTRAEVGEDSWQLCVAKAMTIQEICRLKPSKHGTELIVHLSSILNTCTSPDGETATCIALKTIVGLCTSQTINIASTWSALRELFTAEQRVRPLIVQCEFFGQVPHLVSPTANYEDCLDAGLRTLWTMVATSPHVDVKVAALQALQNFDYKTLSLEPVPVAYQPKPTVIGGGAAVKPVAAIAAPPAAKNVTAATAGAVEADEPPPLITGDFWPHLLQLCAEPAVAAAASDLISHHIQIELRTFRQHMYTLADGHVEPQNYNRLPNSVQSPLRAIVRALQLETNKPTYQRDQHTIRYALRTLTVRLQRPLPPLNWFWTVELMSVEAAGEPDIRHASLRLLAHQQLHSESARQIVENYYREFGVDSVGGEEMRVAIGLFGTVGRGLELATARRWLLAVAELALTEGRRSAFEEGCLFDAVLASCAALMAHGADGGFDEEYPNYALVVDTLAKYYAQFEENSGRMMQRFYEVFVYLPTAMVERIVVPMGWQQATLGAKQWRKALHSCGHLVEASLVKKTLRWLNAAVENNTSDQQPLLFDAIVAALRSASDERDACVWAMDMLCIIQANLTASARQPDDAAVVQNVVMRLRMFFTVVVVRAGFDRLASGEDGDDWRLALFPESLLHVCTQLDVWRENETRIYEFFYNVLISAADLLPAEYLDVIRNMFRCVRSRPYFVQSAVWRKMVGLRQ